MRQIVLDTETTGLSPKEGHRIIEIGCLEMIDRNLTGKHLHLYINPEREIDKGAAEVHGITEEFLRDKPVFSAIAAELMNFIRGAELIIHNAPFDVGFLDHELTLAAKQQENSVTDCCGIVDTLVIARKKHPGQQVSLDALCRRYHVDNSNRELHGALLDAELLAQVYLLMTGGQTQFSFADADSKAANTKIDKIKIDNRLPLPVILASKDELQEHQKMLDLIKKQSGELLWEEQGESYQKY